MPIYEYECSVCGHKVEQLQKINDAPLTTCPDCGEETLARVISMPGFRLKGTGWYETDFKHSRKKPEKDDKPKESKASKTDDSSVKSDTSKKSTSSEDN